MKKEQSNTEKVFSVLLTVIISVGVIAGASYAFRGNMNKILNDNNTKTPIVIFEECRDSGGDIAESYSEQCFINGNSFVRDLGEKNNNEISCLNDNGVWEKVGKWQSYACVYHYSDSGKDCASSSECEGDCIVIEIDGSDPHCAMDSDIFECKATIEEFKDEGFIVCVD